MKWLKKFIRNTKDLALFLLAWLLIPILHLFNLCINAIENDASRFNFRTAFALDVFAAYNYREIWNILFIKPNGYSAGTYDDETLSSILGANELNDTLSKSGCVLVIFLNWLDRDHCVKARRDFIKQKSEHYGDMS